MWYVTVRLSGHLVLNVKHKHLLRENVHLSLTQLLHKSVRCEDNCLVLPIVGFGFFGTSVLLLLCPGILKYRFVSNQHYCEPASVLVMALGCYIVACEDAEGINCIR